MLQTHILILSARWFCPLQGKKIQGQKIQGQQCSGLGPREPHFTQACAFTYKPWFLLNSDSLNLPPMRPVSPQKPRLPHHHLNKHTHHGECFLLLWTPPPISSSSLSLQHLYRRHHQAHPGYQNKHHPQRAHAHQQEFQPWTASVRLAGYLSQTVLFSTCLKPP